MTNEELIIKHILHDYPIYYFMYEGGAGGEFLSNLISKHSDLFRKYSELDCSVNEDNRTFVKIPKLFEYVGSSRLRKKEGDTELLLINSIRKQIELSLNFDFWNFEKTFEQAINYLTSDTKPPLIRCHMSTSSYFDSNTYVLLTNEEKWYDYKEILLFLKVSNKQFICNTNKEREEIFEYELNSNISQPKIYKFLLDGLEYANKNNINIFNPQHIYLIKLMEHIPKLTFDYIFSLDAVTLFKKYNKINNSFSDSYNFFEPIYRNRNSTMIKYSKLFEKGYLEDIFEINSLEFNNKLIEWHETNLELMSNNNIDYTKYKL